MLSKHFLSSILAAGIAAAITTSQDSCRVCNADECISSVVAVGLSYAAADCSSYFISTITQPVVTATAYVSTTVTALPSTVTDLNSLTQTVEVTVMETMTLTVPATATDTASATEFTTVIGSVTETITINAKRGVTTAATIPSYASACTDSAQYSSACSCVGATQTIVTVTAAPTTTTVTSTFTFTSVSTLDETITAIETDYSTSLATSIETDTATVTVTNTATITVSDFVTSTATATAVNYCAGPEPTYTIQISGGAYSGEYLASTPFSGQGVDLATAKTTTSSASYYVLTGTVLTDSNGYTLSTPAGTAFTYAEFRPSSQVSPNGINIPFVCAVTNSQLTCSSGSVTQFGVCNISGPVLVLTRPGYYPSGYGCTNVVLNVSPVCTVPNL